MAQPNPSDTDIRGILYSVLGKWRTGELTLIRQLPLQVEERIVALENKRLEPTPDNAGRKSQLEEQMARLSEREGNRIAMIEDAYERMIDFVDRGERDGD